MRVSVIGKKTIYHDKLGALKPGSVVEMDDRSASRYLAQGVVQRYETKVVRDVPLGSGGEAAPSSVSLADRAWTNATLTESGNGAKRRGRARKAS